MRTWLWGLGMVVCFGLAGFSNSQTQQCWFNIGPTSTTPAQHWTNNGLTCRVCWVNQFRLNLDNAEIFVYKPWRWNVSFNSFIEGIDFRRQNLSSIDVRFWRIKSIFRRQNLTSVDCRFWRLKSIQALKVSMLVKCCPFFQCFLSIFSERGLTLDVRTCCWFTVYDSGPGLIQRLFRVSFFFRDKCYLFCLLHHAVNCSIVDVPVNNKHSTNAVSMLGERRRRWPSIKTASDEFFVFLG